MKLFWSGQSKHCNSVTALHAVVEDGLCQEGHSWHSAYDNGENIKKLFSQFVQYDNGMTPQKTREGRSVNET